MKEYSRDKSLRDEPRTADAKVGAPFLHAEKIDLSIGLFEPPRISYGISEIEVGTRKYTSSFTLEMRGRIVNAYPNVELFELRRCRIEIETVPDDRDDVLGFLSFHDDEFSKYEEYLGEFRLEINIQLIRDLISFLQLNNLKTDKHTDQGWYENAEDNNQLSLTPIKGVLLTMENEERFSRPTDANPTRRRITYEVTELHFLLWQDSLANHLTKVRQLLTTTNRFCQNAEAIDHNGEEVSPLSMKAERWSLLGAIKACYPKFHLNDAMIDTIATHIAEKTPSYKELKEEEAIIHAFNTCLQ